MNEPQIVERPALWPAWCVGCQNQGGPIFDMGVDLPAPGPNGIQHMYLCRKCARIIAKAYGFVKGPRMDELESAADTMEAMKTELAQTKDLLNKSALAAADGQNKLGELSEENEFLAGRVRQLESRIKAHASADLDLVDAV